MYCIDILCFVNILKRERERGQTFLHVYIVHMLCYVVSEDVCMRSVCCVVCLCMCVSRTIGGGGMWYS